MVYLDRIYTRSGDEGQTALGNGTRVAKTNQRIVAYGTVDELNATIGLARTHANEQIAQVLAGIQNTLFDLGADLCVPGSDVEDAAPRLRVSPDQVAALETLIDSHTEHLEPLTSFVLPGGTALASSLHLARTVCRRAEIEVLRLADDETVGAAVLAYLNRLSDLLFVLARVANANGSEDVLWEPGA